MSATKIFCFAIVAVFLASALLGCGSGVVEDSELVATQKAQKVSIECPFCQKRFPGTVWELSRSEKDSQYQKHCPYCGNAINLSSKYLHRFGEENSEPLVATKIAKDQRGVEYKPYESLIRKYNNLVGSRFDILSGKNVVFDPDKNTYEARLPFARFELPSETKRSAVSEPVYVMELPKVWFYEASHADRHGIKKGIPDSSNKLLTELGAPVEMYVTPSNTGIRIREVESLFGGDPVQKEAYAPTCMRNVDVYITEDERHHPAYPEARFRLEGFTDQETVARLPNASRDKKELEDDPEQNPVRYLFHRERDLEGYQDRFDGIKVVQVAREKMNSFGPVDLPEEWREGWEPPSGEELNQILRVRPIPVEFVEAYRRESIEMVGKERALGEESLLTLLEEERKNVDERWAQKEALSVITTTELLRWLEARLNKLGDLGEDVEFINSEEHVKNAVDQYEAVRNEKFGGDFSKEESR